MPKLTKLKALETSARLWRWLSTAPAHRASKALWPGWRSNGGDAPIAVHNCTCCAYVNQTARRGAKTMHMPCRDITSPEDSWGDPVGAERLLRLCPLKALWPKGCCAPHALFIRYDDGRNPEVKRSFALKIANGADEELKRYKNAKKRNSR